MEPTHFRRIYHSLQLNTLSTRESLFYYGENHQYDYLDMILTTEQTYEKAPTGHQDNAAAPDAN